MADKEHKVQLITGGYRYVAVEVNGKVTISRDGDVIGKAQWKDEQLINSSALLPDDVTDTLERKIKDMIEARRFDD
jgi:hypothetical protein